MRRERTPQQPMRMRWFQGLEVGISSKSRARFLNRRLRSLLNWGSDQSFNVFCWVQWKIP